MQHRSLSVCRSIDDWRLGCLLVPTRWLLPNNFTQHPPLPPQPPPQTHTPNPNLRLFRRESQTNFWSLHHECTCVHLRKSYLMLFKMKRIYLLLLFVRELFPGRLVQHSQIYTNNVKARSRGRELVPDSEGSPLPFPLSVDQKSAILVFVLWRGRYQKSILNTL